MATSKEHDKCKHPPCTCKVASGSSYCSASCEGAGDTPDIECMCGHPACKGSIDKVR